MLPLLKPLALVGGAIGITSTVGGSAYGITYAVSNYDPLVVCESKEKGQCPPDWVKIRESTKKKFVTVLYKQGDCVDLKYWRRLAADGETWWKKEARYDWDEYSLKMCDWTKLHPYRFNIKDRTD
ncbi:hypothetical protein MHLP_04100 [Candidatus Mycoplasma haematolamae str. Purdue]|uniref:Uncharacterized protein n=1 Tax=Mycoplasma haematolamae (strain Purdue) TaxID=1212765 RepID=I7BAQ1_MYCHA|nr:hypothetical protein [Candidatus Mycoplasma haematolamae]AFO52400.1 hypothetical protein MHLP_04100 [Candidatus Mycoplasma haematolamae str. Purdue]